LTSFIIQSLQGYLACTFLTTRSLNYFLFQIANRFSTTNLFKLAYIREGEKYIFLVTALSNRIWRLKRLLCEWLVLWSILQIFCTWYICCILLKL